MKIGFVGWRGMVGSVLMARMRQENDFQYIDESIFFSTSEAGGEAPDVGQKEKKLYDANDLPSLAALGVIVTCQGGGYTKAVHQRLRDSGWQGFWIDAASVLRTSDSALIVLDPLNKKAIEKAIQRGIKDFVGGNCTVSLLLMGLAGLFKAGVVEWVSSMTYQSASGAGAAYMRELLNGMGAIYHCARDLLHDPGATILEIDQKVSDFIRSDDYPSDLFGVPLAANLIPWIDKDIGDGQSREEWKGTVEINKIMGLDPETIKVEGICIRVGSMRCHSQAVTLKLNQDWSTKEVEACLQGAHPWAKVVANTKDASIHELTPASVSGSLTVPVGRVRKTSLGEGVFTLFTVGDQLLWGAAEPLRRALRLVLGAPL